MGKYDTSEDIWSNSKNSGSARGKAAPAHSRGPVKKKKKHNTPRIVVNVILSVILVLSLTTGVIGYALNAQFFVDNTQGDEPADGSEADPILISGSDHPDVSYFLVVGTDEEKTLTDIMMVVCFDHGNNTASILQIPRDTFISSKIPSGKVNAVYGSAKKGESQINKLISVINDYFGLPIDHYLNISIDAFRVIVNAMGGIDVYVPKTITAWDQDKTFYTFEKGMNHFSGAEAEAFVRHRKSYAKGDIGRVEAQRNFYAAFAKKLISMSSGDLANVASASYQYIKTDMSIGLMLGYAKAAQKLSLDNIMIEAVPGDSGYARPSGMSQELSYFSVHKSDYVDLINEHFMPYGDGITGDDLLITELFKNNHSNIADDGGTFAEILGEDTASGSSE